MTVSEIIELLKKFDADKLVTIEAAECFSGVHEAIQVYEAKTPVSEQDLTDEDTIVVIG